MKFLTGIFTLLMVMAINCTAVAQITKSYQMGLSLEKYRINELNEKLHNAVVNKKIKAYESDLKTRKKANAIKEATVAENVAIYPDPDDPYKFYDTIIYTPLNHTNISGYDFIYDNNNRIIAISPYHGYNADNIIHLYYIKVADAQKALTPSGFNELVNLIKESVGSTWHRININDTENREMLNKVNDKIFKAMLDGKVPAYANRGYRPLTDDEIKKTGVEQPAPPSPNIEDHEKNMSQKVTVAFRGDMVEGFYLFRKNNEVTAFAPYIRVKDEKFKNIRHVHAFFWVKTADIEQVLTDEEFTFLTEYLKKEFEAQQRR